MPLTEDAFQLSGLCEYLERQDGAYQVFKEALFQFLYIKKTSKSETLHKVKTRVSC